MIKRNWKSWLLAIPALALGIVIGPIPLLIRNFIESTLFKHRDKLPPNLTFGSINAPFMQAANYLIYALYGLIPILAIYLVHKQGMKWTPAKTAFILGLYIIPILWLWLTTLDWGI